MRFVYLFTHSYPFGTNEETFLKEELVIASKLRVQLIIFPLYKGNMRREMPSNIILNPQLAKLNSLRKILAFVSMLLSPLFWQLPLQGKSSPRTVRSYFQAIKYLYGGFMVRNFLLKNKKLFKSGSVFYSYWFNHTPLGFSLAKKKDSFYEQFVFLSRAHGFDVYEDQVGMYFPYRKETLQNIDKIYCVSNKGKLFLKKRYSQYKNKILLSRLGTFPVVNAGPQRLNKISIISVSSIIPLKRVELIYSSILKYSKCNENDLIEWTHIGSGPGFENLRKIIRDKIQCNLKIFLRGYIPNFEVKKILKTGKFNIFINLSTSEGIPFSIMEAISVGIPIIATNVGGNNEIVQRATGRLIDVNFAQEEFNQALKFLIKNRERYSKTVIPFFLNNYNAEKNYKEFYKQILEG